MTSGGREMAKQDEKLVELVAKLIELTQESSLNWKVVQANKDSEPGFTKTIGAVFEAFYKEKHLRIYKREYDNTEENHMFNMFMHQPSYSIAIELEIVDNQGNPIWSFPRVTGIVDLYKAIAYRVAGVDEFLKEILNENEEASNQANATDAKSRAAD